MGVFAVIVVSSTILAAIVAAGSLFLAIANRRILHRVLRELQHAAAEQKANEILADTPTDQPPHRRLRVIRGGLLGAFAAGAGAATAWVRDHALSTAVTVVAAVITTTGVLTYAVNRPAYQAPSTDGSHAYRAESAPIRPTPRAAVPSRAPTSSPSPNATPSPTPDAESAEPESADEPGVEQDPSDPPPAEPPPSDPPDPPASTRPPAEPEPDPQRRCLPLVVVELCGVTDRPAG